MRRDGREQQNRPRKYGVNTVNFTSLTIFLGIIWRRDAAGCGWIKNMAGCGGMKEKNKIDLENTVQTL